MSGSFGTHLDLLNEHSRQLESLEGAVVNLSSQLDEWRPFFESGLQSAIRHQETVPEWTTRLEQGLATIEAMQQTVNNLDAKLTRLENEFSIEKETRVASLDEWRVKYAVTEKLSAELQNVTNSLNQFIAETRSTVETATSQQPVQETPVYTPVVSPTVETVQTESVAPGSSVLRWSRRLLKIEYREVKSFAKQFTDFVKVTKMCDAVATLLLLQHLDGSALTFAESMANKNWHEILKEMADRVKPSKHVVLNELVSCKQNRNERIRDFALRFYRIIDEHPELSTASVEIRAILIDLLTSYWQAIARSIVFHDPNISIESLFKGMTDIEGPNTSTISINEVQGNQSNEGNSDKQLSSMGSVLTRQGKINWQEVCAPRKLLIAWRRLIRSDPSFREECVEWLQRGPRRNFQFDRRGPSRFRGRFSNNRRNIWPRQNEASNRDGRIFNLHENAMNPHDDTMFDVDNAPLGHKDIAMIDLTDSDMSIANSMRSQNEHCHDYPLMYVHCKLNGVSFQCLVDTGAGVSIIPHQKVKKLGAELDKSQCRILSAFNGESTRSSGVATLRVQLGNVTFSHPFCVVSGQGVKVILGNDLLKEQCLTIDPAAHEIILANKLAIPCHAITTSNKASRPSTLNIKQLKVLETVLVDPVIRDKVLFFPSGKSFVLPASSAKTFVLPYQFSETVPVFDSNRLPIGVVCHSTTWISGDRLRIILSNTSNTSKMIGSKAALCCIHLSDIGEIQLNDPGGTHKQIRLFRSEIGCFLPEVVTDLPFISIPDTSQLKQMAFSARMKAVVDKQLEDWLKQDVITEVDYTPLAITPIVLVPKPRSHKLRLCLDFRLVNSCCKQIFSPVLDRHALLQNLEKKQIFSAIDISSAFTCVRLDSRLWTYFGIQNGSKYYVFKRLPFGFHNSMHLFLRAIRYSVSKIQSKLPCGCVLTSYVDDLCLASDDIQNHSKSLYIVFSILEKHGWTVNLSKCQFYKSELLFLGIKYSKNGISYDPALLVKISTLPIPTKATELRTMFGLSLCLQKFNYRLEWILQPLRKFIRAPASSFLTEEFMNLWKACTQQLQQNLYTLTPLEISSTAPMRIFIDTSARAHGAALFQGEHLIVMWSSVNSKPYASSADSEMAGLSKALNAFKPYLVEVPFTVFTDSRAVLSALNPSNQSDVIKRHLDTIQFWFGSQCEIKHLPGLQNTLADLLSRSEFLTRRSNNVEVTCSPITSPISDEDKLRFIQSAHFGHWSSRVTLQNLYLEGIHWDGMVKEVEDYVLRCPNCAFSSEPVVYDLPPIALPDRMGAQVHMDYTGPLFDRSHILVIVDEATKYVQATRTSGTGAVHATQALTRWIQCFGPITTLCTDNASAWNSLEFQDFTDRFGIVSRKTPSYYHEGNSLVERTIQTILHRIRKMLNGSSRDWPSVVDAAVDAINNSWHSTIRTSPKLLACGIDRCGVLVEDPHFQQAWRDALNSRKEKKEYEQERFIWKHRRRTSPLKPLEKVLIRNPHFYRHALRKLAPTWSGPFFLLAQHSNSTWILGERLTRCSTFLAHSSQIRRFHE